MRGWLSSSTASKLTAQQWACQRGRWRIQTLCSPPKCCRIFGGSIGVNAVAAALTGLTILLVTGGRGARDVVCFACCGPAAVAAVVTGGSRSPSCSSPVQGFGTGLCNSQHGNPTCLDAYVIRPTSLRAL